MAWALHRKTAAGALWSAGHMQATDIAHVLGGGKKKKTMQGEAAALFDL